MLDRFSYGHNYKPPVIIDETGLTDNVDLKLDVPFNAPWDVIRTVLRKSGLDLIEGTMPMKVLVIRDAKPSMPVSTQIIPDK